ncbi:hypothetical protein E2562_019048 [Oryza meyeriana var. granulata]|uniref:Uncharacterized protein n=1 Tax=Oryza meyeriana var. granulata TaxID=110450 RepID=A0A6G1EMW9_9ORYZ|nr:hypothetical protein E2562_019048 [Oryza meyeriana var. granulata]
MEKAVGSEIQGGGVAQQDRRRMRRGHLDLELLCQLAVWRRAVAAERFQPLPCLIVGRSAA